MQFEITTSLLSLHNESSEHVSGRVCWVTREIIYGSWNDHSVIQMYTVYGIVPVHAHSAMIILWLQSATESCVTSPLLLVGAKRKLRLRVSSCFGYGFFSAPSSKYSFTSLKTCQTVGARLVCANSVLDQLASERLRFINQLEFKKYILKGNTFKGFNISALFRSQAWLYRANSGI